MPRKRSHQSSLEGEPPRQRLKREADLQSRLNVSTVRSAIEAVLKDAECFEQKHAKRAAKEGKSIDDDTSDNEKFVYVAVTLKQPPFKPKLRPHTILLKHTLHMPGEDEVCFIVKDPQRQIKDYLATHGNGGVTRVLGVEKLRKRYRTHEGRRELLNMYDAFLVDNRVAPMMPSLLGSAFVDAKKMPLSVDMRRDVVREIKRALDGSGLLIQQGTSLSLRVGRVGFGVEKLVENVCVAMDGVVRRVEAGWHDIQSVNVKTGKSPALPVYVTLPTAFKARRKRGEMKNAVEKKSELGKENAEDNKKEEKRENGREEKGTGSQEMIGNEVEVQSKSTEGGGKSQLNGKGMQVSSNLAGRKRMGKNKTKKKDETDNTAKNVGIGEEWGTIGDTRDKKNGSGDKIEVKVEVDKVKGGIEKAVEVTEKKEKKEKRTKKRKVENDKGKKKQETDTKEPEKSEEMAPETDVTGKKTKEERVECKERKKTKVVKPKMKRKAEVEVGGTDEKENSVDDVGKKITKKVKVIKRKKQTRRLGMK